MMKKLKRWAGFALLFCGSMSLHAQTASVISHLPQNTQGYLVLNNEAYPSVKSWQVEVLQQQFLTDTIIDSTLVLLEVSPGLSYAKVPDLYWHKTNGTFGYNLRVTGLDAAKVPVVTEVPKAQTGPPHNREEYCAHVCNGTDYAWKLAMFDVNVNGGGSYKYLQLLPFVNYIDEEEGVVIPIYQYMNQTQYNTIMASASLRDYYGLSAFADVNFDNGWAIKIFDVDPYQDDIFDPSGAPLSGTVYGVQKTLGPWRASDLFINPTGLSSCYEDRQLFINHFNTYSNILPNYDALECTPSLGGEYVDFDSIDGTGRLFWFDCKDEMVHFQLGPDGDIWDLMELIRECDMNTSGGGSGGGIKWPTSVAEVNISRVDIDFSLPSGTQDFRTTLLKQEVISGPTYASFTMDPGLYRVQFRFDDKSSFALYYEVGSTLNNQVTQCEQLDATIYPVPITGNNYNIQLKSQLNMTVGYSVGSPSGSKMYGKSYALEANKSHTETITFKAGIPNGIITHTFTCPDGSVLSIPTLKINP